MREELLAAILAGTEWTSRFTRREYTKAFKQYTETFSEVYVEAVREAGEGLQSLAEEILDGVEAGVARQRIWNRSVTRTNGKMTIVQYLSPMLLGLEEPGCPQFAEVLRDAWNARRPKDTYDIASYKKIQKGFKNVILGIEIPDKRGDEEEES